MRLDNWQTNLSSLIEENRETPFDFVEFNCLLWAGLSIAAVTGENPIKSVIGNYKDEKTALKYLKRVENVDTVEDLLKKHLGELQTISFARIGDIVFLNPDNETLDIPCGSFGRIPGVCYGTISYFVGEQGLINIPTFEAEAALWVS